MPDGTFPSSSYLSQASEPIRVLYQTEGFLFVYGAALAARSRYVAQCLAELRPKPVGSKAETMLSDESVQTKL